MVGCIGLADFYKYNNIRILCVEFQLGKKNWGMYVLELRLLCVRE
jgi:hypothetical protein